MRDAALAGGLTGAPAHNSLVIFAGGRATRLGGVNKALLEVGGRPIIRRLLDELGPLADERLVLANDDALRGLEAQGARLVFDAEPHAGVLPALAHAFAAASGRLCLAVACDMPFASRPLFEHLLRLQDAEDAHVVIPRAGAYLEPMHAVYRREPVLAALHDALARGERRMVGYFGAVRVREAAADELAAAGLDAAASRAFFNVNTPDDLAAAQRLASPA